MISAALLYGCTPPLPQDPVDTSEAEVEDPWPDEIPPPPDDPACDGVWHAVFLHDTELTSDIVLASATTLGGTAEYHAPPGVVFHGPTACGYPTLGEAEAALPTFRALLSSVDPILDHYPHDVLYSCACLL